MACTYELIESGLTFNSEQELLEFIGRGITPLVTLKGKPSSSYAEYNGEKLGSDAIRNDETSEYVDSTGAKYKSVTGGVMPDFQTRPFNSKDDFGTREAEKEWGESDPLTTKKFTGIAGEVNKEQYTQIKQDEYNLGAARGTIFHTLIHQSFAQNQETANELQALFADNGILPSEYSWLNAKQIRRIVEKTGTTYYNFDDDATRTDRITTEKTIVSPTLKWGGTMDMFIDHGDNRYSIFDIKTGTHFDRLFEKSFLKYGNAIDTEVFDNPRNRAKLQIMLYAFMLKVENPEVRFKQLELLHITNKYSINKVDTKREVNVKTLLDIIQKTLKNEHPDLYKAVMAKPHAKSIFDSSHYRTQMSSDFETKHPGADPAMLLKLKIQEVQSLVMYDADIVGNIMKKDYQSAERYDRIHKLMKEIIELRNVDTLSYASWDGDMGWMDRWLGSASSSTNPYVKLYYSMLTEAKKKVRDDYNPWREGFDKVTNELIKESGLKPLTNLIGGIDRTKLYSFAWKMDIDKGRRLIHNKDNEFNSLLPAQKAYLNYVNDSVGQFFDNSRSKFIDPVTGKRVAMANKIITYRNKGGKEVGVTNLDLANKDFDNSHTGKKSNPFTFYEGFFPKGMPMMEDIRRMHGGSWTKGVLDFIKTKYTTNYFEATYDGWYNTDEAIPMKMLGNASMDANEEYTFNIEAAVDNFVKQAFYKQHLDDVYTFGQGLKIYFNAEQDLGTGMQYNKLKEWVENALNLHILGQRQKDFRPSTRSFGVNTIKDGYKQFNWAKFLRSVKNFFMGPTMWLKPFTGLPNFVFASLVNLKEAAKNSMGLGTKHHSNFTLSDLVAGFGHAIKLVLWDGNSTNSYRNNKAYLLMEKFGYLPDSYDWYTRPNQLLTAKNKLMTSHTMMFFHSVPEEMIATSIFIAQLKSMKFTKADGTTSNMWDSYGTHDETLSDGSLHSSIVWNGGVRGKRNTSVLADKPQYEDITDMTNEEINYVKHLYEKMHGGYRADERVAAEYYVFGEMALQLKKYFPSILKNVWASRGLSDSRGYFKTEVDEHGETIMKWTPEVIEGRYRLLIGLFINALGMKQKTDGDKTNKVRNFLGLQFDENYAWNELSEAQKEDLRDFGMTSLIWIAMLMGYFKLWDRKSNDTFKKIYKRVTDDLAGYVNPQEIMKNLSNFLPPVSVRKAYELSSSSIELLWSTMAYEGGYTDQALTKEGNLRGYAQFARNVTFLASLHDLHTKILGSEDLKESPFAEYFK